MATDTRGTKTPVEILQIALKKEEGSYKLYDSMLGESKVGFVRELLEKLREEEGRHIRMIKKRIAQLEMGRG